MQCPTALCIAEEHSGDPQDPGLHVDVTGATWRIGEDGETVFEHLVFDPWTD